MKHLLISTLLIALPTSLWAIEEILNGLDAINSSASIDCKSMSEAELTTQCAHHVCGAPQNKSLKITAQDAQKYLSQENFKKMQDLESDLKRYYANQQDNIVKLADELKKRKASPALTDLTNWQDEDFDPIVDSFLTKVNLEVNYAQPPEKRSIKLLTTSKEPNYLLHQELLKNLDLAQDPLRAFNMGAVTQEEFKKLILKQAQDYQSKLNTLNKKSSFSPTQFSFKVNSGISDGPALIKLYQSMKKEALADGIKLVPSLCHEHCQAEIVKAIKKINPDQLKKNANDALTALTVDDRIAICKGAFLSAHIENTRRDEFGKMWPGIKQQFKTNLFPKFSQHSQQLLTKYLDEDLNFFFSDPARTQFEDISSSLKMNIPSYQSMGNNHLASKALLLAEDSNPFRQDCSFARQPAKLWDVYASKEYVDNHPTFRPEGLNTAKDNISVSPFSCEHQGEGKGIIAHEVGHALSHVMARPGMSKGSAKIYLNLRKCVTAKWKVNPNFQYIYHKGDKLYTEEDTADLISYMAIPDASTPYGCALLFPSEKEYTSLGTSPVFGDNHTPGMIRLLRELQYKAPNRIPETCAELIKRHPDKMGRKCI